MMMICNFICKIIVGRLPLCAPSQEYFKIMRIIESITVISTFIVSFVYQNDIPVFHIVVLSHTWFIMCQLLPMLGARQYSEIQTGSLH
jgi:hypothetical protein